MIAIMTILPYAIPDDANPLIENACWVMVQTGRHCDIDITDHLASAIACQLVVGFQESDTKNAQSSR